MKYIRTSTTDIFILIACVIMLLFSISITILHYGNVHTEQITIEEKTIGIHNDKSYLIYTDKEVYIIKDMFFIFLFNSSDIYSELQIGSRYEVEVSGYRIPFLSEYKRIRKINKLN